MNQNAVILIFIAFLILSCGNENSNKQFEEAQSSNRQRLFREYESTAEYEEEQEKIFDGEYCAEITYYNPRTRKESDYTLTIEVYDNELERINFPNGWLDDDHFGYAEFDEEGYVSFTSDKGYDYTVQIIGESAGCFESVPRATQCIGLTDEGEPCERLTDNPSGYCWQHED